MSRTSAVVIACTIGAALAACSPDATRQQPPAASGAVSLIDYRCESGARIQASYPADQVAVVSYRDRSHEMTLARSASGARYVADGLEWWTKGTGEGAGATLSALSVDGDSGDILERCREIGSER